jgi:hypothetical protein
MKQQLKQIYRDLAEGRLSQREALEKIRALKLRHPDAAGPGMLLAAPVWRPAAVAAATPAPEYALHYVILCQMPGIKAGELEALIPGIRCLAPGAQQDTAAEGYSEIAAACFECVQAILAGKPQAAVLVQAVIGGGREAEIFAGLSGLLKTAMLENPRLSGQVILTGAVTARELAAQLRENRAGPQDALIKYEEGNRHVAGWQEITPGRQPLPVAFKDQGVYLITGGLGGLGALFAREILRQSPEARIILTGRSELSGGGKTPLEELSRYGAVEYRRLNLAEAEQVQRLIDAITKEYRQLNGILHGAGMIADNFILKKTRAEFLQVLEPKVAGTLNLDRATRNMDLDFLVLFSSLTACFGNAGQADYAAANGFMDRFAVYRNQLAAA